MKELIEFIAANPQPTQPSDVQADLDPFSLVGKEILHKFTLESGEDRWFSGAIVGYNAAAKTYEIVYDGETEHQHFDLTDDILEGDLKFVND